MRLQAIQEPSAKQVKEKSKKLGGPGPPTEFHGISRVTFFFFYIFGFTLSCSHNAPPDALGATEYDKISSLCQHQIGEVLKFRIL